MTINFFAATVVLALALALFTFVAGLILTVADRKMFIVLFLGFLIVNIYFLPLLMKGAQIEIEGRNGSTRN